MRTGPIWTCETIGQPRRGRTDTVGASNPKRLQDHCVETLCALYYRYESQIRFQNLRLQADRMDVRLHPERYAGVPRLRRMSLPARGPRNRRSFDPDRGRFFMPFGCCGSCDARRNGFRQRLSCAGSRPQWHQHSNFARRLLPGRERVDPAPPCIRLANGRNTAGLRYDGIKLFGRYGHAGSAIRWLDSGPRTGHSHGLWHDPLSLERFPPDLIPKLHPSFRGHQVCLLE